MDLLPPQKLQSPKSGNRPDECEDDCWVVYPLRLGHSGKDKARIGLADGASESAFARDWAKILTKDFVDRPLNLSDPALDSLEQWLVPCQEKWNQAIPWERIPWHGESKTRAGALATLLGLTFSRTPGHPRSLSWNAFAVGDSCLFLIRQDELILSFPMDDTTQFNNTPALLCSNPANNRLVWESVQQIGGTCKAGDIFILASDALACWLLGQCAAVGKPWQTLLALDAAEWDDWVQGQRQERLMRNDDTTLIIVQVG